MPAVSDINGIFTLDWQSRGTRVKWILAIPLGLGLLSLGVYFAADLIHLRRSGYAPDGMEILLLIALLFVLPGLLVVAALKKILRKPGVYFTGVRTTDSGFEVGKLAVDLAAIEPQSTWKGSLTGRILEGRWEPQKPISSPTLSVLIFLQETGDRKNCHFLDRIVIASQDSVLYQLIGAHSRSQTSSGDLVGVLNGEFQRLGGKNPTACNTYLPSLERIAHVLSTARQASPPSCTLNLTTENTVGFVMWLSGGLVGTLVAAGMDSRRRAKLRDAFKEARLFDADFTQKLLDFTERHGWTITAGSK